MIAASQPICWSSMDVLRAGVVEKGSMSIRISPTQLSGPAWFKRGCFQSNFGTFMVCRHMS
jgi:hypothetical protein